MKKMITMSLVVAATTFAFGSTADDIADLQSQIDKLKAKQGKINAQSANDNIKWGADLRTAIDSINYDMANGDSRKNDSLMGMRLWLNMAYAPDEHNIFKGQLSMNKAFGADFGDMSTNRAFGMGSMFDWTGNESLSDNSLKVKQAYWLYMGDEAFGAKIPWTFSIGRRPSTNGFLSSLSQDDPAQSPLGHLINVEFDGLSSQIDLTSIVGIPGFTFKVCMGRGSTNAVPMFDMGGNPQYATLEGDDAIDNIDLAGFIFVPYNDGQFIVKTNYYKAFDLPGMDMDMNTGEILGFKQYGDMSAAGISVLVDGLTEDGYFSEAKVFGSFAWTESNPYEGEAMLGSTDSESGTSYWFGAYLPVGEDSEYGTFGAEYNHGSQYWRPFTYAEDTMIGSKMAARGDAWEANYTYQINDALSLQARYVSIDYEYTGSNGFFGNSSGAAMKIDDVKAGAAMWQDLGGTQDPASGQTVVGNLMQSGMSQDQAMSAARDMGMAAGMAPQIVEKAQDFRFYLRYRF